MIVNNKNELTIWSATSVSIIHDEEVCDDVVTIILKIAEFLFVFGNFKMPTWVAIEEGLLVRANNC